MLLADPPPSQGDLHFRVFGIPVRVHPWFWGISLLMGLGFGSKSADPINTLVWVVVVFVSILVHEMGHAFLQRYFGGRPRITLYGMGGLAICDDCDRSPRSQILISLAGPLAGFLLAALVVAILAATGHFRGFRFDLWPVDRTFYDPIEVLKDNTIKFSPRDTFINDLLWVNIFWGLVNLLPVYPLDGGRVSREVLTISQPRRGIVQSLWLSIAAAGAVAVFGVIVLQSIFMAIFFGYLAYANYQTLQAYEQHWQ
jgi:stage IV sporulation protein FB